MAIYLLESVNERLACYSFIGTNPYKIIITKAVDNADPLLEIAAELNKYKIVKIPGLPKFCGGAVGYLSYETVTRFEKLQSPDFDPLKVPESVFMFSDTLLIFDHD
jgi:anthranilate synthase component 1